MRTALRHGALEAETWGHSKAYLGSVQVVTHYYGLPPFYRALWVSRKGVNANASFSSLFIDENGTTMFT